MKAFRPPRNNKSLKTQAFVGKEFTAKVLDLTSEGNGVVQHSSGLKVFVPGCWPGEEVLVRVTEQKNRFALGKVLDVLQPHAGRSSAPCAHHGFEQASCGACPWQFINYKEQLDAKQQRVAQALARNFQGLTLHRIAASEKQFGYRVRAQLKTDGQVLGFVQHGSNCIAPIKQCVVLSEENQNTLQQLLARLPERDWRPGKKLKWTTLDIDESVDANSIRINQRLPFQQANAGQNLYMRRWLAGKLSGLNKTASVLELFSGSGNFTQVIAQQGFRRIIAVEGVEESLQGITAHNWSNVETLQMDCFNENSFSVLSKLAEETEILVLDPPRDGLKIKGALFANTSGIQQIFYISCDLATFCRDAQEICAQGFHLDEVQPVDMFPQTPHVELLSVFRRTA